MIDTTTADGVTVLTMEDGENRFNGPFVSALAAALVGAEETALPVVLTGAGKFFCNGLDLDWLGSVDRDAGATMFDDLHAVLARLLAFPVATAAAVNGHAFGAGAMLAAATELRVMREDRGFFCFPEIDLGLPMSDEFNALCQAKFSRPSLLRAWTSGNRYGAEEARRMGFVDETAPEAAVVDRAAEAVRPLAGKSTSAMAALKGALFADAIAVLRGRTPNP